jgi:Concanavalin A-like lectin/glucanases superfamily/Carbohydrate family 9 binding domain-like
MKRVLTNITIIFFMFAFGQINADDLGRGITFYNSFKNDDLNAEIAMGNAKEINDGIDIEKVNALFGKGVHLGKKQAYLSFLTKGNISGKAGTVSFWIKPLLKKDKPVQIFFMMFGKRNRFLVYTHQFKKFHFAVMNNSKWFYNFNYPINWNSNKWYNIVISWQGNLRKFYLNGKIRRKSAKTTLKIDSETFWIGGSKTNKMAEGLYDDLAIWDRMLSDKEVEKLYFNGLKGKSIGDLIKSSDKQEHKIKSKINPKMAHINNGAFEFGFEKGWKAYYYKDKWHQPTVATTQENIVAGAGIDGSNALKLKLLPKGIVTSLIYKTIKVIPGKNNSFSIWLKAPNKGISCRLELLSLSCLRKARGKRIIVFSKKINNIPQKWTRFTFGGLTRKVPANEGAFRFIFRNSSDQKNYVYIDDVKNVPEKKFIEFAVTTEDEMGLYNRDKPVILKINGLFPEQQNIRFKCQLKIFDYYNQVIKDLQLEFKGNKGLEIKKIKFKQLPASSYIAKLYDLKDNLLSEKVFSVVPNVNQNYFPRNGSHFPLDKFHLDTAAKLGSKYIRLWDSSCILRWDAVEKQKGKIEFKNDKDIDLLVSKGLIPVGVAATPPKWTGIKHPWGAVPPKLMPALENYFTKVLTHYKGKIKYWEVWNEPYFHCPPEDYIKILKCFHKVAKKIDPKIKILGPCASHHYMNWLEKAVKLGVLNYIDIFTFHGYAADDKNLRQIKTLAWADGKKRPLWDTEFGLIPCRSRYEDGLMEKAYYRKAGKIMAKNLIWRYKEGIDCWFYYWYNRGRGFLGYMFEDDGTLKPTAIVSTTVSNMLDGAKFVKELPLGKALTCYIFEKNGKDLAVIWNNDTNDDLKKYSSDPNINKALKLKNSVIQQQNKKNAVRIVFPENISLTFKNMLGNQFEINKQIGLIVTDDPIFVLSNKVTPSLEKIFAKAKVKFSGKKVTYKAYFSACDAEHVYFTLKLNNLTNNKQKVFVKLKKIPSGMGVVGRRERGFNLNSFESTDIKFKIKVSKSVFEKNKITFTIICKDEQNLKAFSFNFLKAHELKNKFNFDTNTSNWPKVENAGIERKEQISSNLSLWPGKKNVSMRFSCFYDTQKLYFFINAQNNNFQRTSGGHLWAKDSFELFFDTNLRDIENPRKSKDDYQILFAPKGNGYKTADFVNMGLKGAQINFKSSNAVNHYVARIALSRKALNLSRNGDLIRFDLNMNKLIGKKRIIMSWSGNSNNYRNNHKYGYLLIAN